ncbi:hypothetical protein [Desulfogranum japonicum]|uniref:hypothetical protein n=1 Tax=Desulfogranum japonicum TaxID=231447 RepID=UPI0003FC05A0|nr:hypothetical protein [Desulfogranum japonicum]
MSATTTSQIKSEISQFLSNVIDGMVGYQNQVQSEIESRFVALQSRSLDQTLSPEFRDQYEQLNTWRKDHVEQQTSIDKELLKELKSINKSIKNNNALNQEEKKILLSLNDATRDSIENKSTSGSSITELLKQTWNSALQPISGITRMLDVKQRFPALQRLSDMVYEAEKISLSLVEDTEPNRIDQGQELVRIDDEKPSLVRMESGENLLKKIDENTRETNDLLYRSQKGSLERSREDARADNRKERVLNQINTSLASFSSSTGESGDLRDEYKSIKKRYEKTKERIESFSSFAKKAVKTMLSMVRSFAKGVIRISKSLMSGSRLTSTMKMGEKIIPQLARAGKLLGRFSVPLTIAITTIEGVIGSFKNISNADEILGRTSTLTDKIILGIGGFVEGLASGVDSILSLVGISTDLSGFIKEKLTVPVANWFNDNFSGDMIVKGLEFVSPIHWAKMLGTELMELSHNIFSQELPKLDIKSVAVNLAKSITSWLPDSVRTPILRSLGVDLSEETRVMHKDDGENLVKNLEKQGVIDHYFSGESDINNWREIEKLPQSDLANLIAFCDWDSETMNRLQDILNTKQNGSPGINFSETRGSSLTLIPADSQPLAIAKNERMQTLMADKVEYDKAMEQWNLDNAVVTTVNNNRRVVNSSGGSSRVNLVVPPHETDPKMAALAMSFY